ncbi:S-layer homology domain-containing protein [uncultured Planococcus sp.]|uniref:S-layer homology domain-containing protein n=1 Tax=uncultured Planococcus sp. TaxID=337815 RepID=UPI00263225D4|nr:S-layer homology domain-containing protein [uncultured Planococcus sp.]
MSIQSHLYHKLLAPTVLAALISSTIVPGVSANDETSTFTDVSKRYSESVDYLVSNKLSLGLTETKFGIDNQIKRGDAAVILANALGLANADAPDSGFTDVPLRADSAIKALKNAGIISGKSATKFGFNDLLKRGEIALMLTKASAYDLKGNTGNVKFTDVNLRYREAIAGLVDNEVTQGKTTTSFGTDDNIKRGDYAIFIHRAELIKNERLSDKKAPELNMNGETEVTVNFDGEFVLPDVTATDDKDEFVAVTHVITLENKEQTEVDTSVPGVYTITFSAKDKAGNKAEDLTIKVTVEKEDILTPAIKAAELAISELPSIEAIKISDSSDIQEARQLVTKALEIDNEAEVKGLEALIAAEEQVEVLIAQEELANAIETAENAIKAIPELDQLTLENDIDVTKAREFVSSVLTLDNQAIISGIEKLNEAEAVIEELKIEKEIEAAIIKAEASIKALPAIENLTNEEAQTVKTARNYVNAAYALNPEAVISGIEKLEAAEAKMIEIYKPEIYLNTYASVTINNRIDALSTSFQNLSSDTLTVKNVEIISGTSSRGSYSEEQLASSGINTTIQSYGRFQISITFGIGIWKTDNNYVKYTLNDGKKDYEYISQVN